MSVTKIKDLPKTARGEKTREKLLRAAEKVFGTKGYYAASIAEITQTAKVAHGTFYVYFHDKEAAFRALIKDMQQEMRDYIRERVAGAADRLEAEQRGLKGFLSFVSEHKNMYRIVLESYTVDASIYQEYFDNFAESYQSSLTKAAKQGEISADDPEVLTWCLIGISNFLGMRYVLWDKSPPPLDRIVEAAAKFISAGLRAK